MGAVVGAVAPARRRSVWFNSLPDPRITSLSAGFSSKTGLPLLIAGGPVGAFGHGLLRPTLTSQITQRVSRSEQGVVLGLNQSLMSVSQGCAGPTNGVAFPRSVRTFPSALS